MKIDRSKRGNKDDVLVLVMLVLITVVLCTAMALAVYVDTFVAGFFSATCVCKWHAWIYLPADRVICKLWRETGNTELGG